MAQAQQVRQLVVKNIQQLSPHYLRITLGGEQLAGFPEDVEGSHLKLVFSAEDTQPRPTLRTYTIRYFRPQLNELDIDFVCHQGDGLASCWAQNVKKGETITIRGPGSKKYVNPDADWFLIAGDMTALPAAAAMLESLRADAQGYAIFEVRDKADCIPLTMPEGITLIWRIQPNVDCESEGLLDEMKAVPWLDGEPYVFAAGENSITRKIRRYLVCERQLSRQKIYVSSYWKIGMQEEQHKVHKRDDEAL